MKPALLSTLLRWATGFGLVLCGCGALPDSNASFTPFPDDDVYPAHPSAAAEAAAAAASRDMAIPVAPGTVRTVEEPWRTIEGAPSGRVRMLELYQTAVSQRDRTALRAADLERDLEAALARAAEAEKARADLEARNDGLSTELREIHAKALELARRLAQAELTLLKAEKAELEVRTSPPAKSRAP